MPILLRRVIFGIFVVLFLLVGFLIIFYGSGYQYHFQKNRIEKTGQLSLVTIPKDAHVTINNTIPLQWWEWLLGKTEVTTPSRVAYLLSGQYRVHIQKKGYESWNGTVYIEAGRTTVLDSISLLPELRGKSVLIRDDIEGFEILPKSLLVITPQELLLFDKEKNSIEPLMILKEPLRDIVISPEKKFALVSTTQKDRVIDLKNSSQVYDIQDGVGRYESLMWDYSDRLIAKNQMGITRMVFAKKIYREQLFRNWIQSISVSEKNIWYQVAHNTQSQVYVVSEGFLKKNGLIADIAKEYVLSQYYHKANPLFQKNQEMFLFDRDVSPPVFIPLGNITYVLSSLQELFYGMNDFEIFEFKKIPNGTFEKNLLTREGTPLVQILHVFPLPYVVFLQANGVVGFIRIGNERGSQRYTLSDIQHVRSIRFDSMRKELYILGIQEGTKGIYKISLIE